MMFSKWFSGDDLEHYRTSPHKQRIDAIAGSLLRLQYASEVIRQHLHEWLRFSFTLDAKEATSLPAPNAEVVWQYVAERVAGCSASRSRVLRASVRIFLEADEQGRFSPSRLRPAFYPAVVRSDSDTVPAVRAKPSRTGSEDSKEVHPKAIGVRSIPGGRRRDPTELHHAQARSRIL